MQITLMLLTILLIMLSMFITGVYQDIVMRNLKIFNIKNKLSNLLNNRNIAVNNLELTLIYLLEDIPELNCLKTKSEIKDLRIAELIDNDICSTQKLNELNLLLMKYSGDNFNEKILNIVTEISKQTQLINVHVTKLLVESIEFNSNINKLPNKIINKILNKEKLIDVSINSNFSGPGPIIF